MMRKGWMAEAFSRGLVYTPDDSDVLLGDDDDDDNEMDRWW